MSLSRYGDRRIVCFDRDRRRVDVGYDELMLPFGTDRMVTLAESLGEEALRAEEMAGNGARIGPRIAALNAIYKAHLPTSGSQFARWRDRTREVDTLQHAARVELLRSYYLIEGTDHGALLDELMEYLMAGSEGDHSIHEMTLIRFGLDSTLWSMRNHVRKSGQPAAFHSLEVARGVAKNGQNAVTILGALYHDVLEELLDDYADGLIARVVDADPALKAQVVRGKIPESVRLEVVHRHIEEYNNHAVGIYHAIGMFLYHHVRMFPFPERYYQLLNSLMEMVDKLSRTRDTPYFSYIHKFVFPRHRELDPIRKEDLVAAVSFYMPDSEALLDEYLSRIQEFYTTPQGTWTSREELQRNAFREILIKILDRLNNTRDLPPADFSLSKRLYGAGYKNLYMIQAIEQKMRRNKGMRSDERRLIEVKFLHKPKVAALFQMLEEIALLEDQLGAATMAEIESHLDDQYKATASFREVRPEPADRADADDGSVRRSVDGTVEFFTRVLLGEKGLLKRLDDDLVQAAHVAIVFRSLFESFLAYPALAERDARSGGSPELPRFEAFRIRGLDPNLEDKIHVPVDRLARQLHIKSFQRRLV